MSRSTPRDPSLYAAALGAAALIAHQVGGKASRDALFLSHFDVTALPGMVILAAILSIIAGIATARLMSWIPPRLLVSRAFLASAALFTVEWAIAGWSPGIVAVSVYLQMAALGSALISGFWSLLGDHFDPHTARRRFGRVIAAGTLGGVIGGVLAERVGTTLGVISMLPVLALLHLICAFLTGGLARQATGNSTGRRKAPRKPEGRTILDRYNGFRILQHERYLRHLALLIVLTTIGAGLLDYVFKARAVLAYTDSADLVRFFAIFYTAVGIATFVIQIGLSRISLDKLGLAGTVGTLPFAVAAGSLAGIFIPGLAGVGLARGSEAILRSSLFRSGYELFYAAVPRRDRRATKPILDIGFERFADMLGGLLISGVLLVAAAAVIPAMLVLAALAGLAGLWMSRKLHHGYVKALESNLMNQSIHIDISDIRDSTTRAAVMQTLGNIALLQPEPQRSVPPPAKKEKRKAVDPVLQRLAELRSPDAAVVRSALSKPLEPSLAAHVIGLLAWNSVADDAVRALQAIAPAITGQLVDALVDPSQEFAVRRRIPRVLSAVSSKRAFDGLVQGLSDKRFEVRFQAGRALAQMQDRTPGIEVDQRSIIQAVLQELSVDREVWNSRSVIDPDEHALSNVSFEHVFRLLSLILPRDPLRNAYRGLHSGDDHLKGTAIEYLESVLPSEVRHRMSALLEAA